MMGYYFSKLKSQDAITMKHIKSSFIYLLVSLSLCGCNSADTLESSSGVDVSNETFADSVMNALRANLLQKVDQQKLFTDYVTVKPEVENSALYALIKEMPKGGLLHTHSGGCCDIGDMLDESLKSDDAYVYWGESDGIFVKGQVAFTPCLNIFFGSRQWPENWRKMKDLKVEIPDLKEQLYLLHTYGSEDKNLDTWDEFEKEFDRDWLMYDYKPMFVQSTTKALKQMASEGLQFADIRLMVSEELYTSDGRIIGCDSIMSIYEDILKDVKETYPYFDIRYIFCANKSQSVDDVALDLNTAENWSATNKRIIGFDLVGEEDAGNPVSFYKSIFDPSVMKLPLIMHAGESRKTTNTNVHEALLLNDQRIGHAVNLFNFPSDIATIKARKVVLELCPLSNLILGYVDDLRSHPGKQYISDSISVTFSSDDNAIFKTSTINDDVFAAYTAWNLDLPTLKQCLLNSITKTGLTSSQEANILKVFNERWTAFVNGIRSKYKK